MKIEQIYTSCLAEAAYYIESAGEAIIIDPLRDIQPYIDKAKKNNSTIKYILETHFHADFVSGHLDLAKKTGATIVFGPSADTSFDAHIAEDEEILSVGDIKIKVLHTPGHTMESTTYLLIDEQEKNHAIFTGDTLFIGDVGRPDLAVKSDLSAEDLAGYLYDSLQTKILPLADDIIIYPGHGAGSACGKNMSTETVDKLGNQKKNNYALKVKNKEEFVKVVTEGQLPPPQYFPKNVALNKKGYESIDIILERGKIALSVEAFENAQNNEALVLDVRQAQLFNKGFIPQALNIGLDGMFAVWVGTLIPDLTQKILLITEKGKEEESIVRLARVGYDNVIGYLEDGFNTWKNANKPFETIQSIDATTLSATVKRKEVNILDVRKKSEYEAEHIVGAKNYPLNYLNQYLDELDKNETYYIHCLGGYRSMIASALLKANGFHNIIDIAGGFREIAKTDIKKSKFVCPSTL